MSTYRLISFLREKAVTLRENAGYSGAHHDGGAATLESQIECYLAGRNDKMPSCWKHYEEEFNRSIDSEYQTYLRLKQKFGGS